MKLFLCFSAVLAVALGLPQYIQPGKFEQSQNFQTENFKTEQFQSQGYHQEGSHLHGGQRGHSSQYLPPHPSTPLNQRFHNPGQGFHQNQAQSINFGSSQYQSDQKQQAYGNKLESHQNQNQQQQSNYLNQNANSLRNQNANSLRDQNLNRLRNQNANSLRDQNLNSLRNQNANSQRNQNFNTLRNQNVRNPNNFANKQVYHHSSAQSAAQAHAQAQAHSASSSLQQHGFNRLHTAKKQHSSSSSSSSASAHEESIIRSDANPDGSYAYSYETPDGTAVEQSGYVKNPDARSEDKILSVQGSYSYIAPEGNRISMTYIADENGYRAIANKF